MSRYHEGREWEYMPGEEGWPFTDKDGNEVLGWHDRSEDHDEIALLAEFEAYYRTGYGGAKDGWSLTLRPVLMREATEVECRINGWEEGTLTRCTTRAKHSYPMWQIEAAPAHTEEKGEGSG
jgi:hypothetical protein